MSEKLSTWLVRELDGRGWSHRELARRANISGAAVSRVISGEQNPGWDFCAAVARALGQPPLTLFHLAGLLTEDRKGEKEEDLLHNYRALNSTQQNFIIDIMRGLKGGPAIREAAAPYQAGPSPPVPEGEDIIELFKLLDVYHRQVVYEFTRWQLEQQRPPAASNSHRQRRRFNTEEIRAIVDNLSPADRLDLLNRALFDLNQSGYDFPMISASLGIAQKIDPETKKET